MWQLSQYNQTKLFRMKLETSKHYERQLMEKKKKKTFGQPNINAATIISLQLNSWICVEGSSSAKSVINEQANKVDSQISQVKHF